MIVGSSGPSGSLSPLPGVSGAKTRASPAKSSISRSCWRDDPGEAWTISSGSPASPAIR